MFKTDRLTDFDILQGVYIYAQHHTYSGLQQINRATNIHKD